VQDSCIQTNWHGRGRILYTTASSFSLLCPSSSSPRFQPGFRFAVLCLFYLQFSALILSSPAYMSTTPLQRRSRFLSITASHTLSDFPCVPMSPVLLPTAPLLSLVPLPSLDQFSLCSVHRSSFPSLPLTLFSPPSTSLALGLFSKPWGVLPLVHNLGSSVVA